jgi:hypothetical protein
MPRQRKRPKCLAGLRNRRITAAGMLVKINFDFRWRIGWRGHCRNRCHGDETKPGQLGNKVSNTP